MISTVKVYEDTLIFDEMVFTFLKGKKLARQLGIQFEALLWVPVEKAHPLEDLVVLVTIIDQNNPTIKPYILPAFFSKTEKKFVFPGSGILSSETVLAWTPLPSPYIYQ